MNAPKDTLNPTEQQEYDRMLHNMCVMPGFTSTTGPKVARSLLSLDWIFCNGEARSVKAKHLGLNVYRITTEYKP